MQPQQLPQRALVAVVQAEAGDHLGDRKAGAVAARLQADEPVADPGKRGEHHPVVELDVADPERVCQRGLHRPHCGYFFFGFFLQLFFAAAVALPPFFFFFFLHFFFVGAGVGVGVGVGVGLAAGSGVTSGLTSRDQPPGMEPVSALEVQDVEVPGADRGQAVERRREGGGPPSGARFAYA